MSKLNKDYRSTVLDDSAFSNSNSINSAELILIGILSYISITSVLWTIDFLLKDLFIYFNLIPVVNYWIREILYSGLFFIIYLLFFSKIFKTTITKKKVNSYFFWLIFFLISSQLIQFVYGFYQFEILPEIYKDRAFYYYKEIKKIPYLELVQSIFGYARYLFIIILLIIHHQKEPSTFPLNNH